MPIEYDMSDGPIGPADAPNTSADEPLDDPHAAAPAAPAAEPEGQEAPTVESDPNDEPLPGSETAAPEDAPVELPETAKVRVGKREVVLKDLLDGELMRADYTRKTQALAQREEEMDNERLEAQLERIQTEDFVQRMSSPVEIMNEFSEHQPEAWAALVDMIIEREIKFQNATPEGRQLMLRDEKDARARWRAARDARVQKAFDTHRNKHTARREASKNHSGWRNEAMKSAGLDPANDAHHDLVMDGMASPRNRGKAWTKEMFDGEAARVAKILGAKAPKPAAAAKPAPAAPAAPPAPPKPALPPVRASGVAAPRTPAGKFAPKPKSYENFWDDLRNG